MGGLLDDSVQAQDTAMRGLADASIMNVTRDQQNRQINAERIGGEIGMAGQLIGEAIGSIWHQGQKGAQLGRREGDTYAQIFTGKRPGNDAGGDHGSLLGSVLNTLSSNNKQAPGDKDKKPGQQQPQQPQPAQQAQTPQQADPQTPSPQQPEPQPQAQTPPQQDQQDGGYSDGTQ